VLVGDAVVQYEGSFAAARSQAQEQKLVRTTTIRSTGVRELRGDTARLLVFLDQQTLRTGANE
jgi:Mce-associated membrane protein